GLRYWSLAAFIKRQSTLAERYIERYVLAAIGAAASRGLDGIICGHIHRPALETRNGIVYANDGDWVESLTAITEDAHGQLALVRWDGRAETLARVQAAPLLAAA
ncbi:MAG: UDP-2,3-diacylglucosamine diphosphatase, partial [Xanthomonadales bacterium]|nr:UDP-2,3-diacylglucosamine diphosphatase [Xanthomonadales bacterium]